MCVVNQLGLGSIILSLQPRPQVSATRLTRGGASVSNSNALLIHLVNLEYRLCRLEGLSNEDARAYTFNSVTATYALWTGNPLGGTETTVLHAWVNDAADRLPMTRESFRTGRLKPHSGEN